MAAVKNVAVLASVLELNDVRLGMSLRLTIGTIYERRPLFVESREHDDPRIAVSPAIAGQISSILCPPVWTLRRG